MKQNTVLRLLRSLVIVGLAFNAANAQTSSDSITRVVLQKDSLFWTDYNNCGIDDMMQFVADDIEFYHDKNGILTGKENFRNTLQKNLCGNNGFRLRREAVKRSVSVFPMASRDALYGAIITGEHLFYVLENGKKERPDGIGKFMNLWILENGRWKMSRVLSYDHRPTLQGKSQK